MQVHCHETENQADSCSYRFVHCTFNVYSSIRDKGAKPKQFAVCIHRAIEVAAELDLQSNTWGGQHMQDGKQTRATPRPAQRRAGCQPACRCSSASPGPHALRQGCFTSLRRCQLLWPPALTQPRVLYLSIACLQALLFCPTTVPH